MLVAEATAAEDEEDEMWGPSILPELPILSCILSSVPFA